jgi:menaquinone-dependent protoporphyrinogen IX oxidase
VQAKQFHSFVVSAPNRTQHKRAQNQEFLTKHKVFQKRSNKKTLIFVNNRNGTGEEHEEDKQL